MSTSLSVIAILATGVAAAFLPHALWTPHGSCRTALQILLYEAHFLGQLVLIVEVKDPMIWYAVPRTFVCSFLAIAYCLLVAWDRHRVRNVSRRLSRLKVSHPAGR